MIAAVIRLTTLVLNAPELALVLVRKRDTMANHGVKRGVSNDLHAKGDATDAHFLMRTLHRHLLES